MPGATRRAGSVSSGDDQDSPHEAASATLLKGVDRLLVIATKRTFDDGGFLDVLPEELALRRGPCERSPAGPRRSRGGTSRRSEAAQARGRGLADEVSRHNSPARAEAICKVVAQSSTGRSGSAAILLVLDDAEHMSAACANAMARAPALPAAVRKGDKAPPSRG